MFPVIDKELFAAFVVDLALDRVFCLVFECFLEVVGELPGGHEGGCIVFDVHDISASFEYEGFKAFFAQFFGGPAPADTGPDYDCIKGLLFWIAHILDLAAG